MRKEKPPKLTPEQIAGGVQIIETPKVPFKVLDNSSANVERMARGFILGTQNHTKQRKIKQALEERVIQRIGRKGKFLTDKLFELADGIYMQERTKDRNTIKYYQVPPNLAAITYLIDRALGKPKQHTEISEEKRGVVVIESIIKNLAEDKPIKPVEEIEDPEELEPPEENEMLEIIGKEI